jgi:succinyl-CoA synthetase beta subunit
MLGSVAGDYGLFLSEAKTSMKIHEYQARELLLGAGIAAPSGKMITSASEAAGAFAAAAAGMAKPLVVVKAQVHAGGRGKAGFVKLVKTGQECEQAAKFMLSNRMFSPQTPAEGLEVKKVLVAQAADIADRAGGGKEEFYLAITTDRASRRNVLIASREGGVEIETIAHERPWAIIKEKLDPVSGLLAFQAREVAFKLGLKGKQINQAADIMGRLAKLFIEKDCTLAEINPLVITPPDAANPDGRVMALDAKFDFDDNGTFRHKDILAMYDPSEDNASEIRARQFGLSYVALDGNIGCLVNGAGLAMATMDIIKLHGGDPANFLDVGGSATEEAVTEAFKIILSDPKCKGVLVNIFGGIMKCDIIAQGIVNAAKGFKNADGTMGFKVPLVVRLEGTNVDAGRKLLAESAKIVPTLQAATDLGDAAKKVVAAVG